MMIYYTPVDKLTKPTREHLWWGCWKFPFNNVSPSELSPANVVILWMVMQGVARISFAEINHDDVWGVLSSTPEEVWMSIYVVSPPIVCEWWKVRLILLMGMKQELWILKMVCIKNTSSYKVVTYFWSMDISYFCQFFYLILDKNVSK